MARAVPSASQSTTSRPTNLPLQLTSFIGRVQEIAQLQEWLAQAAQTGTRLLTLTGAGGCGKTRLAIEVANSFTTSGPFVDGIWLVELAALSDAQMVVHAVATTLQIREQANQPLATTLATTLRPRQILLILDNCEHLIEASAELAQSLLRNCPGLTMLATSREALNISGERLWVVPPLAVPNLQTTLHEQSALAFLLQIESVQLFVERACAVQAEFALTLENAEAVVQICRWLDGIPLAIELAAGRIKTLSAAQIAERLDQRFTLLTAGSRTAFARHQTLRATVDWSYELLTEPERILLQRLSLFSGGWTLRAAEVICSDNNTTLRQVLPETFLFDVLARLVDKSLVTKQEYGNRARYFMLETIKQYGWEKLISSGEVEAIQQCHAHFFTQLAEEIEPKINTTERNQWLSQLDLEHDNLRAALRWALNVRNVEIALRLGGALYWFWQHCGFWREGRSWLEDALQMASLQAPTPARAKALLGLGWLAFNHTDTATARARLAPSVRDARATGDSDLLAHATSFLALALSHLGDLQAARPLAEESVERFRQTYNRWGLAIALLNRGVVAEAEADYAAAYDLFQESTALLEELKDDWGISLPLRHMGTVTLRQGNVQHAEYFYKKSLAHLRHVDDKWFVSMSLEELAGLAVTLEHYERAVRLLGAAEALREVIGTGIRHLYRPDHDRAVDLSRKILGIQRFEALWEAGRALSVQAAIAEALAEEPVAVTQPLAHEQVAPIPTRLSSITDEPLAIYAFGSARVQHGVRLLSASDWGFTKPKELLFYLLTYPKRTKEQIGLALWPDASPAQLRNNLHTTLYQLRQALGHPKWILFAHQSYTFNHGLNYTYDVEEVETNLAESKRHLQQPQERQMAIHDLQNAIRLVQGTFAELIAGDWLFLKREELQRDVLDALMTLGHLLVEEQAYREAAALYRQAITWDNLLEEAHRALISCYARLGERGQALRHYQTVREHLWNELQVEPAPETTLLWQRLQQGEAI